MYALRTYFYNTDHELFSSGGSPSNISATLDPGPDEHLQFLIMRPKHLKVMHLNAQSMVSAFDELLLTIKQYPFDVISMSETWQPSFTEPCDHTGLKITG